MKKIHLAALSFAVVALLALAACSPLLGQPGGWGQPGPLAPQAPPGTSAPYQQPNQYGPGGMMGGGMMGGQGGYPQVNPPAPSSPSTPWGPGPYQQGPGGMMGPGAGGGMMGPGTGGGMMGPGTGGGMMGGWGGYNSQAKPITLDQAAEAARRYLNTYFGERLTLTEVMEFAWNFYAEVEEKDTGLHALELLIDKYTGQVSPEMGPNMMWNTKYGMMTSMASSYYPSGAPSAPMAVTTEQAKALAQQFLDARLPGLTAADADTFYGYYTLHTLKGGQVEGMLSVNGYTGAVWYHTWHGPFVSLKEFKD